MNNEIAILSISIVIVIMVTIILIIVINIKKNGKNSSSGNDNDQISGDQNTINKIGTVNYYGKTTQEEASVSSEELTIDKIKSKVKVLFIDDKEFPVVNHLRSIGYMGIDYMTDVSDIDDTRIRYADIIFIDINGVGLLLGFTNQGMGLCGALKKKYGDTKRIILYSGETEGSIFDKDAQKADATLKKDSDIYQFISYITDYAKELL